MDTDFCNGADMNRKYYLIILPVTALMCLIVRNFAVISVILTVCIIALISERYICARNFDRKLRVLTDYITAVQDDLSLPEIENTDESEFGILQSEVYKVVALLREKYSAEKKQKLYMSDMLSDISHQIKTPLTAIQLMTELLEQAELDDEKRLQYAEKIDSQVMRITWLIRNLLTLSQLEAGVLEMKFNTVSLDKIVEQLHNSLDIMAELKGVELDINIPHGMMINADMHWIREALMNLVKNCIEHTDEGGNVKISAEQNNLFTCLTVEDNGSGIGEKDLPHIFERFYKAENASAQSVGIGLSLAKQIISAHNGTLSADSILGEGTRFTLKLYRIGSS